MQINKNQARVLLHALDIMGFETHISLYAMELKLALLEFSGEEQGGSTIADIKAGIAQEKRRLYDIENPPAIMARRRELRLA